MSPRRAKGADRADAPLDANATEPHPPVTQAAVPRNPADRDLGEPGRNAEARRDESLEESYPASDPPSSSVIE